MVRFFLAIALVAILTGTGSAQTNARDEITLNMQDAFLRAVGAVNNRVGQAERRLDRHGTRLGGLDRDVSQLRQDVYDLRNRMAEMERRQGVSPSTLPSTQPTSYGRVTVNGGEIPLPPPPPPPAPPENGVDRDFSRHHTTPPDITTVKPASMYGGRVNPGTYLVRQEGAYGAHHVFRVVYDPVAKVIVSSRRID